MNMKRMVLAILALTLAYGVHAGEQSVEPEVVISPSENKRVKEYRVNGQLYMIEVLPQKGPSYFLVDTDGDGLMETRHNHTGKDVLIPRWILRSW